MAQITESPWLQEDNGEQVDRTLGAHRWSVGAARNRGVLKLRRRL